MMPDPTGASGIAGRELARAATTALGCPRLGDSTVDPTGAWWPSARRAPAVDSANACPHLAAPFEDPVRCRAIDRPGCRLIDWATARHRTPAGLPRDRRLLAEVTLTRTDLLQRGDQRTEYAQVLRVVSLDHVRQHLGRQCQLAAIVVGDHRASLPPPTARLLRVVFSMSGRTGSSRLDGKPRPRHRGGDGLKGAAW